MSNVKIVAALLAIAFLAIVAGAGVLATKAIDRLWNWATSK